MRTLFSILFGLAILFSVAAQQKVSTEHWQEDLQFLQDRIHQDYSFLFRKVSVEDFDKAVKELHRSIPTMEDYEIKVGLARIVSMFQYGHTSMNLVSWRSSNPVQFHQLPYNLYQFNDGLYIQGVHKDYEKALGAKVLKIGTKSVEEAMEAVRPVVAAENDQFFLAYGMHYLGIPEVLKACGVTKDLNAVPLQLSKDGKTFEVIFKLVKTDHFPGQYGMIKQHGDWLDARLPGKTPLWLTDLDKSYSFHYLEDSKTVYVRQSQVLDQANETLADFYAGVFDFVDKNEVDRMVIDVRLNGGGNNYKNKPVVTGLIQAEKINQPGKLFVITGRRTFSACQNLVNELENYTEAIFVGEPTAENVNFFGDNRVETLPNSQLPIRLSYLWWQDKDPRDSRPWTAPRLAIDLSFENYQNNFDPVMATILNYEESGEPTEMLTSLVMEGNMEEFKQKATKYVNDPAYRYYDFESDFNNAGYRLMGNNRKKDAITVFTLNAELYPVSANTWDSLAESYWKSGDKTMAIKYYKKAIAMDPNGPTGANARSMLEQINQGHD